MSSILQWLLGIPREALAGIDSWTLRFLGMFSNLWALMGLLVVFGLLGWLAVRTYAREGRGHRPLKRGLMVVRLITLTLLLILALQPAVVLRYKKVMPTELVVLVDDSLSMRWQDRYADVNQRTRLASFLQVSPGKLEGDQRLSRGELVQRVLQREGGVLAKLAAEHPLQIFRFSAASNKAAYAELLAAVDQKGQVAPEIYKKLTASGFETNLGRAIREALDAVEGRRLAGVVVISDGQDTTGGARITAAKDLLRNRGVGLYAVAVGDPQPPKNILLAQLQGPGEVRKGSLAGFTAFVANRGYGGTEVAVELLRAPVGTEAFEKTGVSEKLTLAGEDESKLQEVPLRVEAGDTGEFVYKAVIAPRSDEMITTDNEAKATLRVSDEKVAVLLVSGDGNWEFQFLRDYLLKHPEHYKVSVWQQNADALFNQEASTGMKLSALPLQREELLKYDVIILHDPRFVAGSMDAPFLGLLDDFVSRHHGGLCYIAGAKFTEGTLLAGGPFEPLTKLLPVVPNKESTFSAQVRTRRTSYPVEISTEGREHPLLQLGVTQEASRKAWAALPGVYRTQPVSRLKMLATALMTNSDLGRQTADGVHEPIIAIQYYGKGRVLYQGFESTWRWRVVDDTKVYERYWGNAVDFLSAGRLEKKRVLVTTGGEVFNAGSEIRVRVQAYNRDFTPLTGKTFTVTMAPANSKQGTDHTLGATRDGFYEGVIPAERTGAFQILPKANAQGNVDWSDEDVAPKRLEIRLPEEEFSKPQANYEMLKELAGDAERFFTLEQIDNLPGKVPQARQVSVHEEPFPIWNRMWVLILLGTLMLGEWTLRKIYHMV